jgi:hypothetical protein
MRWSALATRATCHRGVPGSALARETSPCPTCWLSRSRSRRTTTSSSSPGCRRGVRATTRRVTPSTTSGPWEPSRTSLRFQALSSSDALHASTRCQGRCGWRPLPLEVGGAASRARIHVVPGTASSERSPRRARRRRNHYGRPIASSPAIHPCGREAPSFSSMANATW